MTNMKAVVFDKTLKVCDKAKPERKKGEALIRVSLAGICNTDLEITKGYVPGFKGVLGHEFIGVVVEADDTECTGKRVAGEINLACGKCGFCSEGLERHCLARTVLGIHGKDGAFAEFITLPLKKIFEIPDSIPDTSAVFIEPLAAALEILEQVQIPELRDKSVLLIGDGKLALLIAQVLRSTGCKLTVVGKHKNKLALLGESGIKAVLLDNFKKSKFDVVVEASGHRSGFEMGIECTKPRGTLVLKSTYASAFNFNPFPIVVNEITVVGSRCGRFGEAIKFLQTHKIPFEKYISRVFDLKDAVSAFEFAEKPETLKVLLKIS